jgi:hypothetical protein
MWGWNKECVHGVASLHWFAPNLTKDDVTATTYVLTSIYMQNMTIVIGLLFYKQQGVTLSNCIGSSLATREDHSCDIHREILSV